MPNIGEEIVGAYLKMCRDCDFVDYNVHTRDQQGEIDVIGIDLTTSVAYICEVATHIRGLQYNRQGPDGKRVVDNFERLYKKFKKDIQYARKYLRQFTHSYEFWSPVVRKAKPGAKANPVGDLERLVTTLHDEEEVTVALVINTEYGQRMDDLRRKASEITRDVPIGVFRFLQIDERAGHSSSAS